MPAGVEIKTFIKTHSQILTLVGAFIVFTTFMVREEVREDYKDLVSSIDSAQTVFVTRRDASVIAGQLNNVATIVSDTFQYVQKGPTVAQGTVLGFRFRVFSIKDYAASLEARIDNIVHLLDRLPIDHAQTGNADALRASVASLSHRCDEAAGHLEPWIIDSKAAPTEDQLGDELNKNVVPLIIDSEQVSNQIKSFEDGVLNRAEQVKKVREQNYELTKKISIALFAMGWGLGLIAKLSGLDGAVTDAGQ